MSRYTDGSPVGDGPHGESGLYDWERAMIRRVDERRWRVRLRKWLASLFRRDPRKRA